MASASTVLPVSLTRAASNTDGVSIVTTSITPTNGRPVIAAVASYRAAGDPAIPTASGNGQTWTQVATIVIGSNLRITVFSTPGSSPSAGTVTFTCGAESQDAWAYWIVEMMNVNTTTPVVQSKTNSSTGTATSLNVTLDNALTAAFNIVLGFFAVQANTSLALGTGLSICAFAPGGVSDGLTIMMTFGNTLLQNVTFGSNTVSRVAIAVEINQNGTGAGGMIMARKQGGF